MTHKTGAPVRVSVPPVCLFCSPETQPWEEEGEGLGQGRSWGGCPHTLCTPEQFLSACLVWLGNGPPASTTADSFPVLHNPKHLLGKPSSVLAERRPEEGGPACLGGKGPCALLFPRLTMRFLGGGGPEDPKHLLERTVGWPLEQHPVGPRESPEVSPGLEAAQEVWRLPLRQLCSAPPPPQQGMGGQHGYFGLWVDVDFGKGHSKAKPKCTTYNSPQLSAQENFSFEKMEVWAVGDAAGSQQVSGGHCSALSKLPLSLLRLEVVYPKLGPGSCWTQRCSWTRSRAGSPVPSRRGPWGFIE